LLDFGKIRKNTRRPYFFEKYAKIRVRYANANFAAGPVGYHVFPEKTRERVPRVSYFPHLYRCGKIRAALARLSVEVANSPPRRAFGGV